MNVKTIIANETANTGTAHHLRSNRAADPATPPQTLKAQEAITHFGKL
jgi:hypothetical protein